MPQAFDFRLLLPAPPDHAQVGVIHLVGEEPEDFFRVEVAEIKAVRCGRVGADEKGQKMFADFNDQIAEIFFIHRVEARLFIGHQERQPAASEADMRSVIGQADIGGARKNHQVVGNDARFLELGQGVDLAAGQDFMAQDHIAVFGFALLPSAQAGAHKQFPVESIRDQFVELFLANGRMRCEIDHSLLPLRFELQLPVGVLQHQLGE